MAKATRQERIEEAYTRFISNGDQYDGSVPDRRKLYSGDQVEIGNLIDCVVIETRDDFKTVLVEYTKVNNNYGVPTETRLIGVWPWYSVFKESATSDTHFTVDSRVRVSYMNTDIAGLLSTVMRRGLIDNPDYQRGYVWTNEDKVNLIDSLFHDRDIGKFIFVQDSTYNEYRLEVLDGKQRVNTLIEFFTSNLKYNGLYYDEISKVDRNMFGVRQVQYAYIDKNKYTRAELLQTFLDVNAGGVPQSQQHLDHVRQLLREELI